MSSQETEVGFPDEALSIDIGPRDSGHLVVSSAARQPDTELAIS